MAPSWEVKWAISESFLCTPQDRKYERISLTFLEVVLYICSYREIEQELILRQRCVDFTRGL